MQSVDPGVSRPPAVRLRACAIHLYHHHEYLRTLPDPMDERSASRFCQTYNGLHEDGCAIVETLELAARPQAIIPSFEPPRAQRQDPSRHTTE